MCVVSMVGEVYTEKWSPYLQPGIGTSVHTSTFLDLQGVSRLEFDQLKREVEDLKRLLVAAREYDKTHGQPDCEVEEKMALLRKMAELVGVLLEEKKELSIGPPVQNPSIKQRHKQKKTPRDQPLDHATTLIIPPPSSSLVTPPLAKGLSVFAVNIKSRRR